MEEQLQQEQKTRILLVDDDTDLADLYRQEFLDAGFEFFYLNDCRECLGHVKTVKPDVVLLDILMPHMSGLEVLKLLKQDSDIAPTPVVLLTSVQDDEVIKEGLAAGAAGYLMKPELTAEQVVSEVSHILGEIRSGSL